MIISFIEKKLNLCGKRSREKKLFAASSIKLFLNEVVLIECYFYTHSVIAVHSPFVILFMRIVDVVC